MPMDQPPPSPADLLANPQSVGSQAQFGILLQLLQQMLVAMQGNSSNNPNTVYPFTGTGALTIATAYPSITAGTFSIRKAVAATTTINLPTSGGPWTVADGNGGAAANNITVAAPGGFTIQGASTYVISTNWQATEFILDGSNYITGFKS